MKNLQHHKQILDDIQKRQSFKIMDENFRIGGALNKNGNRYFIKTRYDFIFAPFMVPQVVLGKNYEKQ